MNGHGEMDLLSSGEVGNRLSTNVCSEIGRMFLIIDCRCGRFHWQVYAHKSCPIHHRGCYFLPFPALIKHRITQKTACYIRHFHIPCR